MHSPLARRTSAVLFMLITPALSAQTPETPPRPWTIQADFGFVNTAGNTSTTTLNAGMETGYTTGRWTLGQTFTAVYGRTDGRRSAENYQAGLRADYAIAPRVGMYLMGGWDRNEFAGITRRFEEGTGFRFKALVTQRTQLSLEAGVTLDQQRDLAGAQNDFASARTALRFKQMLGPDAYLQQLAEVLPNLKTGEDVRVNSETALVAPLSSRIAFKAGYVVRFDNLPEPGFKKTDRYLTSGLQVVI
jgi:putative salt-induced outer membrane protein